jgi:hypothetical protein
MVGWTCQKARQRFAAYLLERHGWHRAPRGRASYWQERDGVIWRVHLGLTHVQRNAPSPSSYGYGSGMRLLLDMPRRWPVPCQD